MTQLANSTLKLNKFYNIERSAKENCDVLHGAIDLLADKQPLRFIGLEFEYSESLLDFRIKYYDPELLYKFSTEQQIREGLKYPNKKHIGIKTFFCKKCNTIRVFERKCLTCKSLVNETINTNQLNLEEYGTQS